MRIIRTTQNCPESAQGAVVALGNFDGVHLGHQAILRHTVEQAKAMGCKAAAMTFEPHPREFFNRKKSAVSSSLRIYSLRQKLALLRECGIDTLFLARFNSEFASLSAQDFIQTILHGSLKARQVITGQNFAFGQDRQGNTELLTSQAAALGFGYTAMEPIVDGNAQIISSSAIRVALEQGDIKKASLMLGRNYAIGGHVRHGQKRGKELGFPTANLSLAGLFKPRYGVYAARLKLGDTLYDAVANLGIKPTFSSTEPLLETHAFDMNKNLYGHYIEVQLGEFIRNQKKFDTLNALRSQITADARQARVLVKSMGS
ncbi:MAG: bifunctional riboflavin kinase/FAD synthetase [Rickettsiales bacterium]|nr:bifunctional riboflavin kinase/FAD synthetase [Rickettsiales bacterium]